MNVGDLRLQLAEGVEALPDLGDLDLPELEMGDLQKIDEDSFPDLEDDFPNLEAPAPMTPQDPSVLDESLRGQIRSLIDQGAYQGALNLATTHQEEVMADPEVQKLAQLAQKRVESSAFIRQFIIQAEAALEVGDRQKVERSLQKIRAVDSDHPEVSRLERSLDELRSEPASGEDRIGQLLEEGRMLSRKGVPVCNRLLVEDFPHRHRSLRSVTAHRRGPKAQGGIRAPSGRSFS